MEWFLHALLRPEHLLLLQFCPPSPLLPLTERCINRWGPNPSLPPGCSPILAAVGGWHLLAVPTSKPETEQGLQMPFPHLCFPGTGK